MGDKEPTKNYYPEAQKKYLAKFKDIKVRIPDDGTKEVIEEQLQKLGKGKNNYILDLIEEDVRNNPNGIKKKDFKIQRGAKEEN